MEKLKEFLQKYKEVSAAIEETRAALAKLDSAEERLPLEEKFEELTDTLYTIENEVYEYIDKYIQEHPRELTFDVRVTVSPGPFNIEYELEDLLEVKSIDEFIVKEYAEILGSNIDLCLNDPVKVDSVTLVPK